MFREGAQKRERRGRVDDPEEIEGEAHLAYENEPGQHQRERQEMRSPGASRHGAAVPEGLRLLDQETRHDPGRPDDQTACKRRLELEERVPGTVQRSPQPLRPIIGFGVVERVGEAFVAMVHEMRHAIAFIGQPEGKRRQCQKPVEAPPARRVPVQHLMLQGALPGDQPGSARADEPPGQGRLEIGDAEPAAVDRRCERDGRPFYPRRRNGAHCAPGFAHQS